MSMGVTNGLDAVRFAMHHIKALPPLRPLMLTLKALLKECKLHDVATGGLGSYSLLNMV